MTVQTFEAYQATRQKLTGWQMIENLLADHYFQDALAEGTDLHAETLNREYLVYEGSHVIECLDKQQDDQPAYYLVIENCEYLAMNDSELENLELELYKFIHE